MHASRREAIGFMCALVLYPWVGADAVLGANPNVLLPPAVSDEELTSAMAEIAKRAAAAAEAHGWKISPESITKVTHASLKSIRESLQQNVVVVKNAKPVRGRIVSVGANSQTVKLYDGKVYWVTKGLAMDNWAVGKELDAQYAVADGKNWLTKIESVAGGDK